MAAEKTVILDWLSGLAATIISDADDTADFAARVEVAAALDAAAFSQEALDLMRMVGESVSAETDFEAIKVDPTATGETLAVMQILTAFGAAIGGVRVAWPSRPAARNARQRIAETGETGLAAVSALGADGAQLFGWLSGVVALCVRMVSEIAATATPMVAVETGISLPSAVLAHRLYGDATRASQLFEEANAATPMLMPTRFQALAR
ncbi:hypothetical protein [uncultured Martelella sp.]|uniref:hypothetical protein n=1 Tax=uncultured Martelella sp. TaxID=392331 RepID=UPI0029C66CA6|nr:hypothetical protein [uncultured Martelella sp.]